jgi:hypothetical protein
LSVLPWPGLLHIDDIRFNHLFLLSSPQTHKFGLGIAHQLSCALVLLLFSYLFLIDAALYLNHFYLVILVTFVMSLTPAQSIWSWLREPKRTFQYLLPFFLLLLLIHSQIPSSHISTGKVLHLDISCAHIYCILFCDNCQTE